MVEYALLFALVIIGLFPLVALISGPVNGVLQRAAAELAVMAPR
ncbi:MAG TPA: hypothetical protein VD969_17880 [Symbiobacteriaceae bacterium]|nr:hypothetical protein [Symbiobacteriaceae bacterium]